MTDPYRPDLATFCDILRDYSRHGLSYFKEQPGDMQQAMKNGLNGSLEDNEERINWKLATFKSGGQPQIRFLPMPRPAGNDFKASFFLPRIARGDGDHYTCSFVVLFWVGRDPGKTIAIRFEPSGGEGNSHAYTHLQFTRTINDPPLTTSLEHWIPTSYPAVPLGYDHPIQLFVGMTVAIHGYSANDEKEYVRMAIIDSMTHSNSVARARKILDELKRMLG